MHLNIRIFFSKILRINCITFVFILGASDFNSKKVIPKDNSVEAYKFKKIFEITIEFQEVPTYV